MTQDDQSSCGPLTVAALACAGLGLKPCKATLGVGDTFTVEDARALRCRIVGFGFGALIDQAQYWLMSSEGFVACALDWVCKWAEWRWSKPW